MLRDASHVVLQTAFCLNASSLLLLQYSPYCNNIARRPRVHAGDMYFDYILSTNKHLTQIKDFRAKQ